MLGQCCITFVSRLGTIGRKIFYDDDDDCGNEHNNDFTQDGEDIRGMLKDSL